MVGTARESPSCQRWEVMLTLLDIALDASQVDFTNPENFFHDINSVAGLLKQFFRDLPEALFTNHSYSDFINAARECSSHLSIPFFFFFSVLCCVLILVFPLGIEDDIQRRDSLHALVNNLPDAHYATLRALVLVCPLLLYGMTFPPL